MSDVLIERIAREIEPLAWAALGMADTLAQKNRRVSSRRKAERIIKALAEGAESGMVPKRPGRGAAEEDRLEDLGRLPERYGQGLEELRDRYLNEAGNHEILHLAYFYSDSFSSYVLEHPVVIFDQQAYALAWRAHDAMFDLYQRLGALSFELEEQPQPEPVSRPASPNTDEPKP